MLSFLCTVKMKALAIAIFVVLAVGSKSFTLQRQVDRLWKPSEVKPSSHETKTYLPEKVGKKVKHREKNFLQTQSKLQRIICMRLSPNFEEWNDVKKNTGTQLYQPRDDTGSVWMLKMGGVPTEEEYGGYLGQDGYCHVQNVSLTAPINGWVNLTFIILGGISAGIYFLFLCYMVWNVFCNNNEFVISS